MSGSEAYVFRRLLSGQVVSDYADTLAGAMKRITSRPFEGRQAAWEAYCCSLPDREAVIEALANADLLGEISKVVRPRFATIADFRAAMQAAVWHREGGIPAARIIGVDEFEGTGKMRFALDLARRVQHGDSWPDNQQSTLPKGTESACVCSDVHQGELAEIVAAFRLPDATVYFPTVPELPYGGTDLDDHETLSALEQFVSHVRPALRFIDTLTSATSRNLCEQQVINDLKPPLAAIRLRDGVMVVHLLHLNSEGQTLGRRMRGQAWTLIYLECLDPDRDPRTRLWLRQEAPALDVTIGPRGNEYDLDPTCLCAK